MMNPHYTTPPKWPLNFLRWFCSPELLEDVEGDLCELFHQRLERPKRAQILFAIDVLLLFRPGIIKNFTIIQNSNNNIMIRNHVKTAFRHFLRYKSYALINIAGLTVGIASSLLIFLWVNDEVNKDKFHKNDTTLYSIMRNMHQDDGSIRTTSTVPQPLEILLEEEYPEVGQVSLISWPHEFLLQKNGDPFREVGRYVSPEFLEIFSFNLLTGDNKTALNDISSIVISRDMAEKHFGSVEKSMGQSVKIDNAKDFIVTGVFENVSNQSSLKFEWLVSAWEFIERNDWVENWSNGGFSMVVNLQDNVNVYDFNAKIEQEINVHDNEEADERLFVQKYSDGYLYSTFKNGVNTGGRIEYVRILTIVAIFLLVIACINFMNLSKVRASKRAPEIGVRKVVGANKGGLRIQFFTESFLLTITSVLAAFIITALLLPYFNNLTDKSMIIDLTDNRLWLITGLIILLVGLLSGSYPAFLLPSFNIIRSLKGVIKHSTLATFFRKGLVVFQFVISILLIIGALTVSEQIDYIMNKNLGMDKENIIFLEIEGETAARFETFRSELLKMPQITKVSASSGNPIDYGRSTSSAIWRGKEPNATVEINIMMTAFDFIPTMGMEILEGRDFSINYQQDSLNYIINQSAANIMGFDNPVGEDLSVWGLEGKIIGLVKDFHMNSLYEAIDPLIIRYDPVHTSQAFIKIQGNTQQALASIETLSKELNPDYPFSYSFLDQDFAKRYRSEQVISSIVNIFAGVAIFVSCMGLLGLSAYVAQLRTKEIGIRKVFGANVMRIILLLTKDYALLIILSLIISIPISYYIAGNWLDNFVFRTNLGVDLFLVGGISTIVIAILTIALKSLQAAVVSPTSILKENG